MILKKQRDWVVQDLEPTDMTQLLPILH